MIRIQGHEARFASHLERGREQRFESVVRRGTTLNRVHPLRNAGRTSHKPGKQVEVRDKCSYGEHTRENVLAANPNDSNDGAGDERRVDRLEARGQEYQREIRMCLFVRELRDLIDGRFSSAKQPHYTYTDQQLLN